MVADEELEDSWKALRPEPKGTLTAEQILEIAKALSGEENPDLVDLSPDRLQDEATTPAGLIVPGTIVGVDMGSQPSSTGVTVLSADDPNQTVLGWACYEMTDEDRAERDSPEALEQMREQREALSPELEAYNTRHGAEVAPSGRVGWTCIEVLPQLWGRPWNNAAANFLRCLQPSCVRVAQGEITLDSRVWRVTVYVNANNTIRRIEQEVEVGLVGFRNGQDASNYLERDDDSLMDPQPSFAVNPRAIRRMTLSSGDEPDAEELRRRDQEDLDRHNYMFR